MSLDLDMGTHLGTGLVPIPKFHLPLGKLTLGYEYPRILLG